MRPPRWTARALPPLPVGDRAGRRGAMVLIMALVAVSALRIFTELQVLSNGTGGPDDQSMSIVMMIKMVGSGLTGNVGYASALSVVLFLITALPLLAIAWMNRENQGKA